MLTDEQKYLFDLRGYVVIPSVLSEKEISKYKAHIQNGGSPYEGDLLELLDHPLVMDILREIIAPDVGEGAYGFRCESAFINQCQYSENPKAKAHYDAPLPTHHYHVQCGKIYSGFTRAVWELNEISGDNQGTLLLPGTHKKNFDDPESIFDIDYDSPLWDVYKCPAGSLVIFTANLIHSGGTWHTQGTQRCGVLYGYNHHTARIHHPDSRLTLNEGGDF